MKDHVTHELMHGPGNSRNSEGAFITLKDGRILFAYTRFVEGHGADDDPADIVGIYSSDDGGKTWVEGPERWTLPSGRDYLQEPGAIELNDGRLWVYLRTNTCLQWQTFSSDNGESWSLPEPSRFHSPKAPLSMKRIPSTGDLLAVWVDAAMAVKLWGKDKELPPGGWGPGPSWGRTPLVAAISRDDGKHWSRSLIIEREPDHGYGYSTIYFTGDAVLLAYHCGGGDAAFSVLQDLRIRRVPLNWFYGEAGDEHGVPC